MAHKQIDEWKNRDYRDKVMYKWEFIMKSSQINEKTDCFINSLIKSCSLYGENKQNSCLLCMQGRIPYKFKNPSIRSKTLVIKKQHRRLSCDPAVEKDFF